MDAIFVEDNECVANGVDGRDTTVEVVVDGTAELAVFFEPGEAHGDIAVSDDMGVSGSDMDV